MPCVLCNGDIEVFYRSETSISVSSDCKIISSFPNIYSCLKCGHVQKHLSQEYKNETDKLYANYSAYRLTGGEEQLQFVDDVSSSRTQSIMDNTAQYEPTNAKSWLDVGTGSGVMLQTVSKNKPKYELWGHDVSAHNAADVLEIAGVKGFFAGGLDKIKQQKFDIISANHVLEHVMEPTLFIEQITDLLAENGILIIQVPDILTNPYDLCIFDHVSHFQTFQLVSLLSKYFSTVIVPTSQIFKEITVVATNGAVNVDKDNLQSTSLEVLNVEPLSSLNKLLKSTSESTAIFSTGPIGLYAGACLGAKLSHFLDEDKKKIGKRYLDVPIISTDSSNHCPIINPQPKANRDRLVAKYPDLKFVEY